MKSIPKGHELEPGDEITIEIFARQKFSFQRICVNKKEQYQISCAPGESWTDWKEVSSPDGFDNKYANFFGKRVANAKCFCLCGTYNASRKNGFAIGSNSTVDITENGDLSFFANDTWWAYYNNKGSIEVKIKRTR